MIIKGFFFYISLARYVVTPHLNRPTETVHMTGSQRMFFFNSELTKINPNYQQILTLVWSSVNSLCFIAVMGIREADKMANSADSDHTAPEKSDSGLHCLLRPICPNIQSFFGYHHIRAFAYHNMKHT